MDCLISLKTWVNSRTHFGGQPETCSFYRVNSGAAVFCNSHFQSKALRWYQGEEPDTSFSKEKRWMHSTRGVHPPLHCFSQMLLFGGEGTFGNPPPWSPGLYSVHQGVSPCASHCSHCNRRQACAPNCPVKNGLAYTSQPHPVWFWKESQPGHIWYESCRWLQVLLALTRAGFSTSFCEIGVALKASIPLMPDLFWLACMRKRVQTPLVGSSPDTASNRKEDACWGTSTLFCPSNLVPLCSLPTPSPRNPFSSGKCPSDGETLYNIPALSENLGLVGCFYGWLVWEGGDSNYLRMHERKERLAFAAG